MNQAPQPIPIATTTIEGSWLAKEVSSRYSLGHISHCYLLRAHLSHFYIAQCANKRFAVRVSLGDWITSDQIKYELTFLNHLRDHDIPTVVPLANKEDEYFFEIFTTDGRRMITVFEWIDGIEVNEHPQQEHIYRLGVITAKMHETANTFGAPKHLSHSLEYGLKSWVPLINSYLSGRDSDLGFIMSMTEKVITFLPQLTSETIPWSTIHGDLHAGNAMLSDSNQIIVLDFDLCGRGPMAYDIASYIWASEKIGVDKTLETNFLAGYEEIRRITPAEKEALPLLIVAKSIWWLALRAILVKQLGSKEFSSHKINVFMSRLRRDAKSSPLLSDIQ